MATRAETGSRTIASGLTRYAAVAATVGVYIALGFLLRPGPNAYLLMGIPITAAFQLLVARRSLPELWTRRDRPMRFDRWTLALIASFLIGPAWILVIGLRGGHTAIAVYGVVAMLGSFVAAGAFRVLRAPEWRQLGWLLAVSVPVAFLRLLLDHSLAGAGVGHLFLTRRLLIEGRSLLFYVPATFVVEEVLFRGALDSYLHRSEHGFGWGSAAYVSVLWGLWHTPIAGRLSLTIVLTLIGAQLFVGLILSWLWRRSGNLAMPAAVHALLDAVRNALLA